MTTTARLSAVPSSLACVFLLVCAGCASKPVATAPPPAPARNGEVAESIIESPASAQYPIELGVSYEPPVTLGAAPLPEYPADQLAKHLPPQQVDVRMIVAADGKVSRVDPLTPPDDTLRPFVEATRAALLRWEFAPLLRIENDNYQELAFHQDYRFTFTQVDGKPQVEAVK